MHSCFKELAFSISVSGVAFLETRFRAFTRIAKMDIQVLVKHFNLDTSPSKLLMKKNKDDNEK